MIEELMEWEHVLIQPTISSRTSKWEDGDKEDEFVIIAESNSVFPPTNHEDLPIITTTVTELVCNFQESPPLLPVPRPPSPSSSWWRVCSEILNSGIVQVAYKVRFYAFFVAGFWRFMMAAGVAGLVLVVVYGRVKWWRRRRLAVKEDILDHSIIREKDQKINQLLLQIARMNDILSASRRVPVLRVD